MTNSSSVDHRALLRAYQLIGYRPPRDYRYLEINRRIRQLHPEILDLVRSGGNWLIVKESAGS